ncbi:MAG: glutamine-hydrolyzing GMP synthase [Acidobacteria bacterium]|nr:glutamine-hydrolyzing GMP synthase [Acidobacteriota bacterium]
MRESIVILDFGSQYTQLIARRVRESNVYSEILPFSTTAEEIRARQPRGIILSGGPDSVSRPGSPQCEDGIFQLRVPVLGICYGMQLMAQRMGGEVVPSRTREYGRAQLEVLEDSRLFSALPRTTQVWMSHGDTIVRLPQGFRATGQTPQALGAMECAERSLFGLQFHPEVVHTPEGAKILKNFLYDVCGCQGTWTMHSFIEESVASLRTRLGSGHALCGISGGIDSAVAALLVQRAIGDRLHGIFVDNGLLRQYEFQEVMRTLRRLNLNVLGVDASARFLEPLRDVEDPEQKRKIIGRVFVEVFEEEASRLGPVDFLVQGTLYPDVIESVSVKGPSAVIKSHHNVGGLPEKMRLKLIEPLRELFKDEVRRLGLELGLEEDFVRRHPFPGPGLAVRILGPVSPGRLDLLRRADTIVQEEVRAAGLYNDLWQAFAVLLPIKSVGVMGDERTYEHVTAVRAVTSQDGMTADWVPLPYDVLVRISNRIVNEVKGINRVVYDISSKPPSTIEWE